MSVATYTKYVPIDLGVMDLNEETRLTNFREKPTMSFNVSMGIYVMSRGVLDEVPDDGMFGFDDLMHLCLEKHLEVRGFRHDGIWLDIGRPDDYQAAVETFNRERHQLCPWEKNKENNKP